MKRPSGLRRAAAALAAWAAAYLAFWHFTFLESAAPWAAAACAAGAFFLRPGRVALAAVSLLLSVRAAELVLRVPAIRDLPLYRDVERLKPGDGPFPYRPGQDLKIYVEFGDAAYRGAAADREPHTVRWRTDSLGFRNDADYAGEPYVLVGDSFVAGSNNDQADLLQNRLRELGLRAYNLGAAGADPADYAQILREFDRVRPERPRALLFFYEGNDFVTDHPPTRRSRWGFWRRSRLRRLTRGLDGRWTPTPEVLRIGTHRLGFIHEQVARLQGIDGRPEAAALAAVRGRVERVFFVPTKYRVYHAVAGPRADHLTADAPEAVRRVARSLGAGFTDLTPDLVAESLRQLERGEFTYWKDDSHWNRPGIEAAARSVVRALGKATE